MAAKFTVYTDRAKKFRFNLKATNGEIIATGEAYETKAACLNGIKSIQKNAPAAKIEDTTVPAEKKAPAKKPAPKTPGAKTPRTAEPKKQSRKPKAEK
ncbi:MAG: YegP family protein [Treponema sp.]|jgi:uncharacterized protein YegP (UPF0339 family)|nr:YegP family protein [Treponema sp.]